MSTYSYALICGRLEQYVEGSVRNTVGYDGETPLIEWTNILGNHCVGDPSCFISGSLEELQSIIADNKRKHEDKVRIAQSRFPLATPTEKIIIDYMVGDGYDPEEITYHDVKEITEGTIQYMAFNSSLLDAYMDYVH